MGLGKVKGGAVHAFDAALCVKIPENRIIGGKEEMENDNKKMSKVSWWYAKVLMVIWQKHLTVW